MAAHAREAQPVPARDRVADGRNCLDRQSFFVGVRDIRPVLRDPETGEPRFRFDINGQPLFLRGADWAPLEGMTHCWNQERAVRLLDLMEHGRMNVLRIWGEGNIPPPEFYDECDRRGFLSGRTSCSGMVCIRRGTPSSTRTAASKLKG